MVKRSKGRYLAPAPDCALSCLVGWHRYIITVLTGTDIVPETSEDVNYLKWFMAQEDFSECDLLSGRFIQVGRQTDTLDV
jgi:hypothetical protein